MADLFTTLRDLENDSDGFRRISRNPLAQFGRPARQYLGATLLPERMVEENAFREDQIKYRTIVANAGTRYSPTQKKDGDLIGSFLVELGESDIAREFTSRQYDALLRTLERGESMEAMVQLTNWLDTAVNLALIEHVEKERWLAIVDASVPRTGDNEYSETVSYSNPAGHRVNQGAAWSTDTTDIFSEIMAGADLLASKGYTVNRIITGRPVLAIMAGNNTVKTRVGVSVVNTSGQITSAAGRASQEAINGVLQADGLPPIELYDLQYRTQTGTAYFLERDVLVMVGTTGQSEEIDLGDTMNIVSDTLGYSAIGRAAGQNESGRVIRAEAKMDKPPRIEAEGWQTSLPVITEPEAIYVIDSIT
jgi:hypothetical protein